MAELGKIYDLIIVGADQVGITAAVYAIRKRIDFLVLTANIGGQVTYASQVRNYTGFQYIAGEELAAKFYEHLKYYVFNVKLEEVKRIEPSSDLFSVKTAYANYLSKTIIVAEGLSKTVSGLRIQKSGEVKILLVQGVFVEIGSTPNSEIINFVEKN